MLSSQLAAPELLAVLGAATSEASGAIADACVRTPTNGWELCSLLVPSVLGATDSPDVFSAACELLAAVGVALSPYKAQSYSVLSDYLLPFLLPLLRGAPPSKVATLLKVVYSYVADSPEAHIDAIRALQNAINDQAQELQHTWSPFPPWCQPR